MTIKECRDRNCIHVSGSKNSRNCGVVDCSGYDDLFEERWTEEEYDEFDDCDEEDIPVDNFKFSIGDKGVVVDRRVFSERDGVMEYDVSMDRGGTFTFFEFHLSRDDESFKVGDWVRTREGNIDGEVTVVVETDGEKEYKVDYDTGSGGGSIYFRAEDLILSEKPDFRMIPSMDEKQFDEAAMKVIDKMKETYVSMSIGDLQTAAVFANMFKREYLREER